MNKVPFGLDFPNHFPLEKGMIQKAWSNNFMHSGSAGNMLTTRYTATAILSGAAAISTAVHGGVLRFSNNSTDASSGANVRGPAYFKPTSERFGLSIAWASLGLSNALNSILFIGLSQADTDLAGAVTSFVGFRKDDADNTLKAVIRASSADVVAVDVAELSNGQRFTCGVQISLNASGLGTTTFYFNGQKVYTYEHTSAHVITTAFHGPVVEWKTGAVGSAQTFDLLLEEGLVSIEGVSPES